MLARPVSVHLRAPVVVVLRLPACGASVLCKHDDAPDQFERDLISGPVPAWLSAIGWLFNVRPLNT